jgi:membrane-bound acyltransferase YfiQ involved in biofilm formation
VFLEHLGSLFIIIGFLKFCKSIILNNFSGVNKYVGKNPKTTSIDLKLKTTFSVKTQYTKKPQNLQ